MGTQASRCGGMAPWKMEVMQIASRLGGKYYPRAPLGAFATLQRQGNQQSAKEGSLDPS